MKFQILKKKKISVKFIKTLFQKPLSYHWYYCKFIINFHRNIIKLNRRKRFICHISNYLNSNVLDIIKSKINSI